MQKDRRIILEGAFAFVFSLATYVGCSIIGFHNECFYEEFYSKEAMSYADVIWTLGYTLRYMLPPLVIVTLVILAITITRVVVNHKKQKQK